MRTDVLKYMYLLTTGNYCNSDDKISAQPIKRLNIWYLSIKRHSASTDLSTPVWIQAQHVFFYILLALGQMLSGGAAKGFPLRISNHEGEIRFHDRRCYCLTHSGFPTRRDSLPPVRIKKSLDTTFPLADFPSFTHEMLCVSGYSPGSHWSSCKTEGIRLNFAGAFLAL